VIELRALVSARTSPIAWDLRCEVREKLIAFLREDYPGRCRASAPISISTASSPVCKQRAAADPREASVRRNLHRQNRRRDNRSPRRGEIRRTAMRLSGIWRMMIPQSVPFGACDFAP